MERKSIAALHFIKYQTIEPCQLQKEKERSTRAQFFELPKYFSFLTSKPLLRLT